MPFRHVQSRLMLDALASLDARQVRRAGLALCDCGTSATPTAIRAAHEDSQLDIELSNIDTLSTFDALLRGRVRSLQQPLREWRCQ